MMYYWLATRNVAASLPKWRSLALLLRSPTARKFSSFRPPPPPPRHQVEQIYCLNGQKNLKRTTRTTKKFKALNNVLDDKDLSHIMWWKERLQQCRKPSTIQLVKRLIYTNLLGLDVNLKNGSLKEGNLNWEILQFKSQFPREILLCRVGDFYEAIGIDACFLVEYAGLNPFGGQRVDSIPRAGCPVVNLRQTLDDLTRHGYSVCIVEEVQGPTHARSRKGRFISGHAHPGSPYVFGLAGIDHDLDFPEPMPVVGISRSARGYCMISVLETMKTYSLEDGLTEEALVTKIRTCQYHYLFLHSSLRNNSSETCRWGEFGEGGLLWGECVARHFEWFEGNPITELLFKVTELYGLGNQIEFRNATVPSENRPRPLYLGTATQIGCIPTEGIPCLLKVLLPASCTGLPVLYVRDLLLNPPAYEITSAIQETCKLMSNVMCSIPAFTCVSSAKLVKLLELREVNHIEFCRIKNVLDEILQMYRNSELNEILKSLMEPTWVATGLKIDFETLISECEWVSGKISEMIAVEGESEQKPSTYSVIPNEFFEDMESSWKGRVKRVHIEDEFEEVERAAQALALTVTEDFLPIITRIKATTAPLGGPKGEILYAREHEAIWFKGKRFVPAVWAGTPGEEQIKQLRPAVDSKGKKVGEEWFTTVKVEDALMRYHDAGEKAKAKVLELLKGLSAELQTKMNVLVFASMLLVIAKALFAHVSEGRRRKWVFPSLMGFDNHKIANICTLHDLMIYVLKHPWAYIIRSLDRRYAYPWTEGCFLASNCHWKAYLVHEINKIYSADTGLSGGANRMHIVGLSPYWLDPAEGSAVQNTVNMQSLFLLTGPNGGGKSSLLRSICAAALLGICGFMVPAESAVIPHFDSIMLHMKSYDSPADGKSSFQVEMSEIRSLITGASSRSLVLVDEICRGTETAKGTCIAGSIVETLDKIGCLGIVSTHLHGIFDLPLDTKNTECKAMGTEYVDGQTKPTWRLRDGTCRESLAFETAKKEGIPEAIIQRAEDLYFSAYNKGEFSQKDGTSAEEFRYGGIVNKSNEAHFVLDRARAESFHHSVHSMKIRKVTEKDVESVITLLCQRKLIELYKLKNVSELVIVQCVAIGVREQPPPSTIGSSCVYVMLRPDKKLYVGVTDDIDGRVRAHRAKEGMATASFLYFIVPGKSIACQLETLLVNQLPHRGFPLTNMADGKHRNFGATNLSLESVTVH